MTDRAFWAALVTFSIAWPMALQLLGLGWWTRGPLCVVGGAYFGQVLGHWKARR